MNQMCQSCQMNLPIRHFLRILLNQSFLLIQMIQSYQNYLHYLLIQKILHYLQNLYYHLILRNRLFLLNQMTLHYLLNQNYLPIHEYLKNFHQRQTILQFLMYQMILIVMSQLKRNYHQPYLNDLHNNNTECLVHLAELL